MSKQFKPMLASTELPALEELVYPVYATYKIDGIRALTSSKGLLSRSLKPHKNKYVLQELSGLVSGLDGELIVRGADFNTLSGDIRREDGKPDFEYLVFDCYDHPEETYLQRCVEAEAAVAKANNPRVRFLCPVKIDTPEELQAMYDEALELGHEGLIIRSADGPYKYGRATAKSGWMRKFKPFEDAEATCIGFYEQMHNGNEGIKNELGRTARSQHQENLVPMNTLGGLELRKADGTEFRCGTGFDDKTRKEIWDNRPKYLGQLAKYKSMTSGEKDKPRHPVFLGWRDPDDL